jgi:hypothetical protein
VDGTYDNDYSKIALAVTAAQLAKATCVKEFGVGEDLSMNFFGWDDDSLLIVCQMGRTLMNLPVEDRLQHSSELCSVLRKYWGVKAITMVAEGYCSYSQAATEGLALSKAFLDPKKPVKECVTVTHVSLAKEDADEDGFSTTVLAVPYIYELGRTLKWFDMLVYTDGGGKNFRNSKFPQVMKKGLKRRVIEDLVDEAYVELREIINSNGFHVQEFY